MGKKEFLYSVLASIVAAAILEVSGVFSLLKYLNAPLALPVWSILALIIAPIFLSLYWFRKTKTPEHEAIIEQ
ncbi:ABC transporter ATP-binding protein, partial [Vibrio parahaemolyticus]|uniref:ABC transporter ATP-binding protein n=3 Tax=Vibrio parahaemolyticus TaxID=670 RepID=UPI00137545E4